MCEFCERHPATMELEYPDWREGGTVHVCSKQCYLGWAYALNA